MVMHVGHSVVDWIQKQGIVMIQRTNIIEESQKRNLKRSANFCNFCFRHPSG